MGLTAEERQRRYYAETAATYDHQHCDGSDGDHHTWALDRLDGVVDATRATSILDVGTGTGRVLAELGRRRPGVRLHGVDPVAELLDIAVSKGGIPRSSVTVASGDSLPFADDEFDIVCEFGVLHHVPDPGRVIEEMLRVARLGVVISDHNRFGRGSHQSRLLKVVLDRLRLWQTAYRASHGGKRYSISPGDGLAYSYSVFDNYGQVAAWADEISLHLPAVTSDSWLPALTGPHVVLAATRNARQAHFD